MCLDTLENSVLSTEVYKGEAALHQLISPSDLLSSGTCSPLGWQEATADGQAGDGRGAGAGD